MIVTMDFFVKFKADNLNRLTWTYNEKTLVIGKIPTTFSRTLFGPNFLKVLPS